MDALKQENQTYEGQIKELEGQMDMLKGNKLVLKYEEKNGSSTLVYASDIKKNIVMGISGN